MKLSIESDLDKVQDGIVDYAKYIDKKIEPKNEIPLASYLAVVGYSKGIYDNGITIRFDDDVFHQRYNVDYTKEYFFQFKGLIHMQKCINYFYEGVISNSFVSFKTSDVLVAFKEPRSICRFFLEKDDDPIPALYAEIDKCSDPRFAGKLLESCSLRISELRKLIDLNNELFEIHQVWGLVKVAMAHVQSNAKGDCRDGKKYRERLEFLKRYEEWTGGI